MNYFSDDIYVISKRCKILVENNCCSSCDDFRVYIDDFRIDHDKFRVLQDHGKSFFHSLISGFLPIKPSDNEYNLLNIYENIKKISPNLKKEKYKECYFEKEYNFESEASKEECSKSGIIVCLP